MYGLCDVAATRWWFVKVSLARRELSECVSVSAVDSVRDRERLFQLYT